MNRSRLDPQSVRASEVPALGASEGHSGCRVFQALEIEQSGGEFGSPHLVGQAGGGEDIYSAAEADRLGCLIGNAIFDAVYGRDRQREPQLMLTRALTLPTDHTKGL